MATGKKNIVALLLEKGADITIRSFGGKTALNFSLTAEIAAMIEGAVESRRLRAEQKARRDAEKERQDMVALKQQRFKVAAGKKPVIRPV